MEYFERIVIALITAAPPTIAAIYMGKASLLRIKEAKTKLDENTEITKEGSKAAASNARVAANAAHLAVEKAADLVQKTEDLKEVVETKLNGGLDERINAAIEKYMGPLVGTLNAHIRQTKETFQEFRDALGELRDRTTK